MHQVQLADKLYEQTRRRAAEAGYSSVDDYIADLITQDIIENDGDAPNLDHLFTPERLAELDRVSAEIRAGGKTYTSDEAAEELSKRRAKWLKEHH